MPRTSLRHPSRRLAVVTATAALLAALAGCGSGDGNTVADPADPAATATSPTASTTPFPSWVPTIQTGADGGVTGLDFSGTTDAGDQLQVVDVTTGDGPPVQKGQTITANYFGQLPTATKPFDESFSKSPFSAPIGVGSLIQGWDEGLVGVPVGSRVIMSVPSDLGYGDAGSPPDIPGGATLVFVIDIIAAK